MRARGRVGTVCPPVVRLYEPLQFAKKKYFLETLLLAELLRAETHNNSKIDILTGIEGWIATYMCLCRAVQERIRMLCCLLTVSCIISLCVFGDTLR